MIAAFRRWLRTNRRLEAELLDMRITARLQQVGLERLRADLAQARAATRAATLRPVSLARPAGEWTAVDAPPLDDADPTCPGCPHPAHPGSACQPKASSCDCTRPPTPGGA